MKWTTKTHRLGLIRYIAPWVLLVAAGAALALAGQWLAVLGVVALGMLLGYYDSRGWNDARAD